MANQKSRTRERPTKADVARLVRAWTQLGSPVELEHGCRELIDRPGYDVALRAYEVAREHVTTDRLRPPATHHQELRDLKDEAAVLNRRVRGDLRALERLHRRASKRKWYGRAIRDGRIVGPAQQSWRDYARAYANTALLLERDPCLRFLATTTFSLQGRGNPAKSRNSALRRALRGVGLSKRQVDAVLAGLGWTTVR